MMREFILSVVEMYVSSKCSFESYIVNYWLNRLLRLQNVHYFCYEIFDYFQGYTTSTNYLLSDRLGPATWIEAKDNCSARGQVLLTIPTQQKEDSLPHHVSENG